VAVNGLLCDDVLLRSYSLTHTARFCRWLLCLRRYIGKASLWFSVWLPDCLSVNTFCDTASLWWSDFNETCYKYWSSEWESWKGFHCRRSKVKVIGTNLWEFFECDISLVAQVF